MSPEHWIEAHDLLAREWFKEPVPWFLDPTVRRDAPWPTRMGTGRGPNVCTQCQTESHFSGDWEDGAKLCGPCNHTRLRWTLNLP